MIEAIGEGAEEVDLGGRRLPVRAYCAHFNFKGADQQKAVGVLSGGERNRLNLARARPGPAPSRLPCARKRLSLARARPRPVALSFASALSFWSPHERQRSVQPAEPAAAPPGSHAPCACACAPAAVGRLSAEAHSALPSLGAFLSGGSGGVLQRCTGLHVTADGAVAQPFCASASGVRAAPTGVRLGAGAQAAPPRGASPPSARDLEINIQWPLVTHLWYACKG